jgi:hypothetical protein
MKKILSIFVIILLISGSVFAADDDFTDPLVDEFVDDNFDEFAEQEFTEDVIPVEEEQVEPENSSEIIETTEEITVVNKTIYVENYFSLNPLLGFTLSPFDSNDRLIASGLQFDFYKYYGYKNYGTYFKFAVLQESYSYGSYEILFGGSYRFIPFDKFELFANLGPTLAYYNNIEDTAGTDDTSLLYAGVDTAVGLRFYPLKDNNKFALDIGLSGSYMWNIPFDSNASNVIASRYKVIGFVGYTYVFKSKAR